MRLPTDVLRQLWPGWNVSWYHDERNDRMVVNLSVGTEALQDGSSHIDKIAKGASVQELAEQIASYRKRTGLRRYGRRR